MTDSAIHLRPIGTDDWPLWRELRLQALQEAPYAFGSKLAEWQGQGDTEQRWRNRLASVPLNLIAELNGTAAGMVSATSRAEDGSVELISMWVAPFARACGIGNRLVSAVVEWARQQGASTVLLAVVVTNEHAIALYRRNNFVDAGLMDCSGSDTPERQMARQLQ